MTAMTSNSAMPPFPFLKYDVFFRKPAIWDRHLPASNSEQWWLNISQYLLRICPVYPPQRPLCPSLKLQEQNIPRQSNKRMRDKKRSHCVLLQIIIRFRTILNLDKTTYFIHQKIDQKFLLAITVKTCYKRRNLSNNMNNTKVHIVLVTLLLLMALIGCGGGVTVDTKKATYTGTALLSWSTPTTNSDGSPLPATNIKGYRVYIRTPSGAHNCGIYFVSAPSTSVSIKNFNLPVGQYYFTVTTLDISGMESGFSNEAFADLK